MESRTVRLAGCVFACLALIAGGLSAQAALTFSPPQWKAGMIARGEKIQIVLTVSNPAPTAVSVSLVPTCSCLSAEPETLSLAPRSSGSFRLGYDSSDDVGLVRKDFIVRTARPSPQLQTYSLFATVRGESSSGRLSLSGTGGGPTAGIAISYYYTPGCKSCEEFLSVEVPRLSREIGRQITVERKDILQPTAYEELGALLRARGQSLRTVPVLAVAGDILQGEKEIREQLAGKLRLIAAGGFSSPAGAPLSGGQAAGRLAVPVAVAGGLVDGVNPCAFTTLIFLLASLALAGRGRREVFILGLLFSLAVFLTYFAIGLGFFAALRAAAAFSIVSAILRWALAAALLAVAGLSLYDYVLIRRGRPTEILLQLPSALKRRIHGSIRARVRTATLAGSSLALGFLVSIFEFACTGQVYLPILTYLARVRTSASTVGLLALYNFCFILPLLAVFGASYAGVSSAGIARLFQIHMGKVKLGVVVLFIGLAVFTIVS
jgi:cytochrome c biogenesis protein CcdA